MQASRSTAQTREKGKVAPRRFSSFSHVAKLLTNASPDWSRVQRLHILSLFKRMTAGVPAYERFVRSRGVQSGSVRFVDDIPVMSKSEYIRTHDFSDLFWNGSTESTHVLTSTSGSTGEPAYFARSHSVDDQASIVHEIIFRTSSLDPRKSTLVIVCFGMGVWIGGVITYQAFELMGRRGYPVSVLTPGINKAEILKALAAIAPHYDQLVLAGYPPFLKDVIDEARASGISFSKHRVMLLFAAEAFTENFRDHLAEKVGLADPLTDAVNIYGSADIGSMAFETPVSILARRLALKDKKLFADLFGGTAKTPTLAQYIPGFVSFEALDGEILISGDSAIPLLRYSIGDHGGVYTFDELVGRFNARGVDLLKDADAAGIKKHVRTLPFVYVYERADLATTLYGLQVYPETIKEILLDKRFNEYLTGKLTLITKYDEKHDQYLEVNLELRPGKKVARAFAAELTACIVKNLLRKNSEFHELSDFLGKRSEPKLVFWPYEDPSYFKSGIKQRWAIREPER